MGLFKKTVTAEEFGEILFEGARERTIQLKDSLEFREDCDKFKAFVWPMVFNFWIFGKVLKGELEQDKVKATMQTAFQNLIDILTKGLSEEEYYIVHEYIKEAAKFTDETMKSESVDAFNNPVRTLIKQLLSEMYDAEADEMEILITFEHYAHWIKTKDLTSKFKIK